MSGPNIATMYNLVRENNNVQVRQAFLSGLDLEKASPYVERVTYMSDNGHFTPNMGLSRGEVGKKCTIRVYDGAFQKCPTLDEFLSFLIDHEGYHAKEKFTGQYTQRRLVHLPLSCLSRDFHIQNEILARKNQLAMINDGRRNVPSGFIAMLKSEICSYYAQIF